MAEQNVTSLAVHNSAAALQNKAFVAYDKTSGAPIALDAKTFLRGQATDLSMFDIYGASLLGRETANCYVVRKVGFYKIPLVYGNGVKRGIANTAAYSGDSFVNHRGVTITDPYIEHNAGISIHNCGIAWSDENNLIQELELAEGEDCKYLHFAVHSIPELNGNAIIYIADSNGNVIWSWHIWVTADDLSPITITNHTGTNYKIMPQNLGWKWDVGRAKGKNVHYQWGRKDPFPCPVSYASNTTITLYNAAKTFTTEAVTASHSIADSIKRPNSFFIGNSNDGYRWEHSDKYNLWDANRNNTNADSAVIAKTIYDPSPVGYTVANGNFATGFSTTGNNTDSASNFKVIGSFNNGWTFKRNNSDAVGVFFAASGCRNVGSGSLNDVGSNGYYWVAAPSSATYGRNLYFNSGKVYPLYSNDRALGFSVRAVQES